MLVIAHHNINDPENFWATAEKVTEHLPTGLKVLGVYPAQDGKTGTCVWEANNVAQVQEFLDDNSSDYAKNFCYEVNVKKAIGLPFLHLEEAHLS